MKNIYFCSMCNCNNPKPQAPTKPETQAPIVPPAPKPTK